MLTLKWSRVAAACCSRNAIGSFGRARLLSKTSAHARQVTVTGGTGFVATQLVKQLLEKGYTVNATVRAVNNEKKVAPLRQLGNALPGVIRLFEADLLQPGSFDEAVKGSRFVFHTASPVTFEVVDAQKELVDPAVKGTENVLSAVSKSKDTVKRVVLTSSIAAVRSELGHKSGKETPKNGLMFTEDDWNTHSDLQSEPYGLSKVASERAAWDWSKREGISLVAICPAVILGPLLDKHPAETAMYMKAVLEGNLEAMFAQYAPFVDVRDVARAHVLAAEVATASGRYILGHTTPFSARFVSQVLQARFPELKIPDGNPRQYPSMFDNTRVRGIPLLKGATQELGLHLIPQDQMLVDAATTMLNFGIAKPQLAAATSR